MKSISLVLSVLIIVALGAWAVDARPRVASPSACDCANGQCTIPNAVAPSGVTVSVQATAGVAAPAVKVAATVRRTGGVAVRVAAKPVKVAVAVGGRAVKVVRAVAGHERRAERRASRQGGE